MGMLSLAGIVSGAGAGAGKSLRQAQTYLNWEMLQEERGKLELQRDERVNENIIARENRHRGQVRADLEESQSEPFLRKQANADAYQAELTLASRAKLRTSMAQDTIDKTKSDLEVADTLRPFIERGTMNDAKSQAKIKDFLAQDAKDRTIASLKDPKNKEIYDLTLKQAAQEMRSADEAIVERSQYLHEHEVIGLAYKNVAKLGMTRTQELTLEDLEFNALHRKENYDATQRDRLAKITDRDADRISRMLTSSERALEGYRKSIAATTNEIEKTSLQDLENQELRLHHDIEARARKIFGLPDAPPFKLSDKLNGGTTTLKGAKPKTPNYDPSSFFDSISDEELIVAPPRKG